MPIKLSVDRKFSLGLILAGLCLSGVMVLSYRTTSQLEDSLALTQRTLDILVKLETVFTGLVELETTERGYLLTGDEHYQQPYLAASGRLDGDLAALTALLAGNELEAKHLAALGTLVTQRRAKLARAIEVYKKQGLEEAQAVVRTGEGQKSMDALRGVLGDMAREQNRLLDIQKDDQRRVARTSVAAASLMALLTALLLLLIYALMRREMKTRAEAENARADAYAQLEERVVQRTEALQISNAALAQEIGNHGSAEIALDQSQRELAEASAALARSEARLSGIIATASDTIITVDETQRIVLVNPAAETVFRCRPGEMVGAPLERFIPERHRAAHRDHIERFGATGVTARRMGGQLILSGLRCNGEEFPIEASISQLVEESGRLYTVILRDVTERKQVQDALEYSHRELQELSSALQSIREEERKRIARELHDDLGQLLAALRMDLSLLKSRLSPAQPELSTMADKMDQLVLTTVVSLRRIAADLRPKVLDDIGLYPALQSLVGEFSRRQDIACRLVAIEADLSLDETRATSLFRMTQEALNNVAKHARATIVTIAIERTSDDLVLTVQDNGRGMSVGDRRKSKSFGLIGMRERAYILGGDFSVESQPGAGTTIRISLPLPVKSAN